MSEEEPKRPSRAVAIVLAAVAGAALVFSVVTDKWLTNGNDYEEISFGLRSMSQCAHALGATSCATQSNSAFVQELREPGGMAAMDPSVAMDTSSAFAPMGWVTLVAALVAALGLFGAAAIAAAGKRPELPMTPSTLALLGILVGIITGCVFIATKPGPVGFVGAGLSFWVFGGGCVLGIAAAQMLAKVNRPLDPDLMQDAMNADEF